jgi:hypothetical protein
MQLSRCRLPLRLLLIQLVLVTLLLPGCRGGGKSDFDTPWEVDMPASLAGIKSVPETWRHKELSLEEYRAYVQRAADKLTITLQWDKRATITGGWNPSTKSVWYDQPGFDYWIYTSWGFMAAGVGHGFIRTGPDEAKLKFQIAWSEDVATREFLILRRAKKP